MRKKCLDIFCAYYNHILTFFNLKIGTLVINNIIILTSIATGRHKSKARCSHHYATGFAAGLRSREQNWSYFRYIIIRFLMYFWDRFFTVLLTSVFSWISIGRSLRVGKKFTEIELSRCNHQVANDDAQNNQYLWYKNKSEHYYRYYYIVVYKMYSR